MKVLISGASGLVGSALRHYLGEQGHEVVALVRRPALGPGEIEWDPRARRLDGDLVSGFDAVVHLAGAGIGDRPWTKKRRRVILESRVAGTGLLAQRLAAAATRPRAFISASAIGYYGSREEPVSEETGPAEPANFLSDVTRAWESAAAPAAAAGIRTVLIRSGIVVAGSGKLIGRMMLPLRLYLGGPLGSGDTWWSWISLTDEVRAIVHLLESDLSGPVNLTSPRPVTIAEFTRALGRVMRRPVWLRVPRFAIRLVLGREFADAMVFASARVVPGKLLDSGFSFVYPEIEQALRAELADS
jgi:uncharacterized protein (TIGR01777 family)